MRNELVEKVNFDSEGNLFAATSDVDVHRLYKFNPDNEIIWTIDLPDHVVLVTEMLISSRGDVYFQFHHSPNNSVAVLRSGSTEIEEIGELSYRLFLLDNDDNLFYCKDDGVYMLRPDSSVSVLIKNLEGFREHLTEPGVIDKSGNIYFAVQNVNAQNNSLAVVTREALEEEIPYATFINALDNSTQYVENLLIDEENNLWITITDDTSGVAVIKKLVKGNVTTILTDSTRRFNKMVHGKGRTYIIGGGGRNHQHILHHIERRGCRNT